MSNTLYRKYRPQLFSDLIDQEFVKQTLQSEIKSGKIAHAYLFTGPRGLGKTTTARLLSKAVNCKNRKGSDFEPCNKCDSCSAIINNQSLDLIEIDAASNRGINEIRKLKEHIGFTPAGNNYRVFIIDEVHMLTPEAFNALLKTLEEPPPHAIFILATTELNKVPDTIISRCQTFTFRRVDEKHLFERLNKICKSEGIRVDEKVLEQIAHMSGGFIRDAESMLGQLLSLGEKTITTDLAKLILPTSNLDFVTKFLSLLSAANVADSLRHINDIADQGIDLEYFSKDLLESLRQLLISEYGTIEKIDEHLRDLQGKFEVKNLLRLIGLVDRALHDIKKADIPQLPLELVVIEYLENQEDNESKNKEGNYNEGEKISENQPELMESKKEEINNIKQITTEQKISKIKLKDIEKKWTEVIDKCSKLNHSLPMSIKVAHLLTFNEKEANLLELGFDYELHVARLKDGQTRQSFEKILQEVFESPIKIDCRILSKEESEKFQNQAKKEEAKHEEKLVENVMEAFEGQLVGE